MANWNVIENDFGGDETGNFGPRMETGSSLYQVDTTATISSQTQVIENPKVLSCSVDECIFIATDCNLTMFQESGHKLTGTSTFDHRIDVMDCDEDGAFVVLGDCEGYLHLIDVLTQQIILSKRLETDVLDGQAFHEVRFVTFPDGSADLLVIACSGRIIRFCQMPLLLLQEAVENEDAQILKEAQAALTMQVVETSEVHTEACISVTNIPQIGPNVLLTAGQGENILCLWDIIDTRYEPIQLLESTLMDGAGVLKCHVCPNSLICCVLDENHCLSVFDMAFFSCIRQWTDTKVLDFMLLETGNTSVAKLSNIKLVLLTQHDSGLTLAISGLSSFKPSYTIALGAFTHLVSSPPNQEAIFFLDGVSEKTDMVKSEDDANRLIESLRVRCLTEADPETRYHRLLNKKQFDEAESLSKLFSCLDPELVYHVKANHLLNQLAPWNVDNMTDKQISTAFVDLMQCLEMTKDAEHLCNCCVKAYLPTFSENLQLLNYARLKLNELGEEKITNKVKKCDPVALLTMVLESMHRLATYEVVFGIEKFSGSHWQQFHKANLRQELLNWLHEGHVDKAFTIWRRHQSDFEDGMTVEEIDTILHAIPWSTDDLLSPWLKEDFIPFIIRIIPEALSNVARWLEQRARNMEQLEKSEWPQNGLSLCELLQHTCVSQSSTVRDMTTPSEFATQMCNLSFGHSNLALQQGESADAFFRLQTLIVQLRDLLSLHTKYGCKLSLAEYVMESTESLTYCMLNRVVAIELIPDTITTVVRPYMKEQNLKGDKMLAQYIENLTARQSNECGNFAEAHWEYRAISVIGCIREPEYKCAAILHAMQHAYIPWNDKMKALVDEGLTSNHSSVPLLQQNVQSMELQKLLKKYDVWHYNRSDTNGAETLLDYIIHKDQKTALEDALKVVSFYDHLTPHRVYFTSLIFLIRNNRLEDAIDLIHSLEESEQFLCCQQAMSYVTHHLDSRAPWQKWGSVDTHLTEAACWMLRMMTKTTKDELIISDCRESLKYMSKMLALQQDYGEFMTYANYCCAEYRRKLFTRLFIESEKAKLTGVCKDNRTPLNEARISRLSELLLIPRETFRGQLAVKAAEMGNYSKAISLSNDLYEVSRSAATGEVLYQVAYSLCTKLAEGGYTDDQMPDISQQICTLASQATAICEPALIADCLELSKAASKAHEVLRQCESGDYGATVMRVANDQVNATGRDPYSEWTFDDFFTEDGLVMDSAVAMPFVYQYATACIPNGKDELTSPYTQNRIQGKKMKVISTDPEADVEDKSPVQSLILAGQKVIGYLHENSQTELALQYVFDLLGAVAQYTEAQVTCFPLQEKEAEYHNTEVARVMQLQKLGKSYISDLSSTLLRKMSSPSRLDHGLSIGYMLLDKHQAIQKIGHMTKSVGLNYKKLLQFSRIGKDFASLASIDTLGEKCDSLEKNAEWGKRLGKLKVSFKEVFKGPSQDKRNVLPQLVRAKSVDIDTITEFCSAFTLDRDEALMMYLEYLLLKPVDDNPSDVLVKKALPAVNAIVDGCRMHDRLTAISKQIDPYNYERLQFVYACMHEIKPDGDIQKWINLLYYLETYQRIAPPSEYEINFQHAGEEDQIVGQNSLSSLAKEKLPLAPFVSGDPWKIISPELNESNMDVWIPFATLLQLPVDQLYLTAVQNEVNKHINDVKGSARHSVTDPKEKSKCDWSMDEGSHANILNKVKSLLLKVSNCELAVACANWVVKTLPMGSEKVLSLKMSVSLAEKWLQNCREESATKQKAVETFKKFSDIYRRLSTEQVLFQHQLGEPELLALANSPARLIFKLYEHPTIAQRSTMQGSMLDHYPDIHKVTEQVAKINSVGIAKVRRTLVEKWLPSILTNKMEEADMTMNMTFDVNMMETTVRSEEDITEDEINLKRVMYLMQEGDISHNVLFLLNFAYSDDSTMISTSCRVRALRCVFSLVDNKTIESIAKKPLAEIRNYMQTLLYLIELHRLHIPHTADTFAKCNKEGLVRGVWSNHSHEKRAVRFIADICLDYELFDVQLWNSVLQQLMTFKMVDYLRHVLICLSRVSSLWQVDCIQKMWHSVLIEPLASAVCPLGENQLDECIRSVALLHRCPLLLDMDLHTFIKHLVELELLSCAVGCILYLHDDAQRTQQLQQVLDGGNHGNVLKQITQWLGDGRTVPMLKQILNAVYDYINLHALYDTLEDTNFKNDFVTNLIAKDELAKLILALLKKDRLTEAITLVQQYKQSNADFAKVAAENNLENMEMLMAFLYREGLYEEAEEYLPPMEPSQDEQEPVEDEDVNPLEWSGNLSAIPV